MSRLYTAAVAAVTDVSDSTKRSRSQRTGQEYRHHVVPRGQDPPLGGTVESFGLARWTRLEVRSIHRPRVATRRASVKASTASATPSKCSGPWASTCQRWWDSSP